MSLFQDPTPVRRTSIMRIIDFVGDALFIMIAVLPWAVIILDMLGVI